MAVTTPIGDRLVHPRRSRKAQMLGSIEDAARALARSHQRIADDDELTERIEELNGWAPSPDGVPFEVALVTPQDADEVALARLAYDAERSKMIAHVEKAAKAS